MKNKNSLSDSLTNNLRSKIDKEMNQVQQFNEKINDVMVQSELESVDESFYVSEVEDQIKYDVDIEIELDLYAVTNQNQASGLSGVAQSYVTSQDLINLMSQMSVGEGRPPPLNCGTFTGKEKDKFAFNTFLNQFNNVIGSRKQLTDATKLAYLVGYLRDYALSVVKHLSITDTNYDIAIQMLKNEFLDKEFMVDETYKNILKAYPNTTFDPEYSSVKIYLNEMRSYLSDLKTHGFDFLESGTAGHSLISHIIFNKLPVVVKKEFIHVLDKNYPSITEILDNYHRVITTLSKTSSVRPKTFGKASYKPHHTDFKPSKTFREIEGFKGTLQNFKNTSSKFTCKLCGGHGHSLGQCNNFTNYEAKIARLNELSLCTRCAGSGHNEHNCFGKQGKLRYECRNCHVKEHITPLCPSALKEDKFKYQMQTNVSLCLAQRSFDSCHMLPTMTLTLKNGKMMRQVRCLVDTGSQRSYISESVAQDLCPNVSELFSLECDVSTYIGEETKVFKQMSTGIKLHDRIAFVPLLVDKTLDIKFYVPGMNAVINKFKLNNMKLLDDYFYEPVNHEHIQVDMLLGIDVLQNMTSVSWQEKLGGSCLVMHNKAAPIGNVFNFLAPAERQFVMRLLAKKDEAKLCSKTKTMVNAVMDPLKSYYNPLEHLLEDTDVENGLEHLFSFESMGIKTTEADLVSLESEQIKKFEEGISFKDGHYNVELPWYQDKIESVPSNHFVALKVLDRTLDYLKRKNLLENYQAVFDQQLDDGIIEEIEVKPAQYDEKIWIPHRPVIKMEEQVTTKIRPVFNCSLKTNKDLPSLNEAAYPGVDLMNSILQLLFYFRTNKLVMLSDVKQAFLMIKLKDEVDQNRFCFFWKRGNKLVTYRFKTIVFGFTSSPFMLHYVMRHHANTFPDDKLSKILANNFYVDNLIVTGNETNEMQELYHLAYERMKAGGFTLRSWNSNSTELRTQMANDGRLVEHTSEEEKVLGYRYNVQQDSMNIALCKIDPEANTKRKILSQTSKLFDPLNFTLPVTIRGKLLMRKIWKLEKGWDDTLPDEICSEMKKLSRDLEMLSEVTFPRQALNEQNSYGLHIFCDSSAEAYGFVAYALDGEGKSTYLHSKSKVAPLNKGKEHSIPTLELMAVILALKCLPTILEAYNNIQIQFVNICVDAQVVLNWLLTKDTKVKSKFLKNRVSEAEGLKSEINKKFKMPVAYHYVNTEHNPADLITKGLTYSKYLEKIKFWLEGPQWLTNDYQLWPQYPLLSIAPSLKSKICTACTSQTPKINTGILNINKYSSYEDLLKCTTYLFKFLSKIKDCNPKKKALEYWVKVAQTECYQDELKFLQNPSHENERNIPLLVSNLNLFLDDRGIIRSRGRISKCQYFKYEIHHPVLLPKDHRLTKLIINDCHNKMQHLGIGTTLNYLREQGYWIPKGRMAVKQVLSTCHICKKYNALAFKYPKFTDMPKHQMNLVIPFQHVGVDYTGHFWVRDENSGHSVKVYVLIFTCLNIRAVHFELLPDMSTKNFLLAFHRFCNRYSIPHYLYSDNAKAFLKGGNILESSLQSKEVQEELEKINIKHVKIPLYSAWIGAAWERLIRVLKTCLYKVVGRAKLTYFEMLTSLSNIQLAINSRPLTYRSSSESLEFITPNSFLKLHGDSSLVLRGGNGEIWVDDQSQPSLEKTIEEQELVLESFKKLWYESYLLSLREHSRNLYQCSWENKIKEGDIVLIRSLNKPRPFWLMGRVLQTMKGLDGKIRTVQLKQSNGAVEFHSICNLYPLELTITHAGRDSNRAKEDTPNDVTPVRNGGDNLRGARPKRKATDRFNKMLRDDLEYL